MPINTSPLNNGTALLGIAQFVNNESGGIFGILLMISLYAVFWAVLSQTSTKETSFAITTWVMFFLTLILWTVGLLPDVALYISIIAGAIGFLVHWLAPR